ncbi:MAG: tol-pal system protein YbgF, partial [Nitrospirae bacterium]|nr:tol-pal system protein YbgF [Nitrospirota bacterium]
VMKAKLSIFLMVFLSACITLPEQESQKNTMMNVQLETMKQRRDVEQIRNDISDLSSEVAAIKKKTDKDISAIKKKSDGAAEAASLNALRESQASLLTQLSQLTREVQMIKGQFEENKYFTNKRDKELSTDKESLSAKASALEKELKEAKTDAEKDRSETKKNIEELKKNLEEAKKELTALSQKKITEAASRAADTSHGDDPQRLYDNAQTDYKEKRYAEGRKKFERLLKDYPEHSLVPNSHFWIGETYYAQNKYEDAILSYENLLKKYPDNEKAVPGMLKQGYAFAALGDKKTAKVILERLIEKAPKSKEAELAEKKIAELFTKAKTPAASDSSKSSAKGKTKKKQ